MLIKLSQEMRLHNLTVFMIKTKQTDKLSGTKGDLKLSKTDQNFEFENMNYLANFTLFKSVVAVSLWAYQ